MRTKLLSLALGLASICSLGLVSSAHATEPASVGVETRDDIAWVEATATGPVARLKIEIMAPGRGVHRNVWQTCRFSGSGAGTHRCGIDVSVGSPARQREGTWVARVSSGGAVIARTTFTL